MKLKRFLKPSSLQARWARRIVHTLGVTQLRGPSSWDVVDNQGRRFVAEIRHRSGGGQ
jgi:hypothetical protein